MKRTIVRTLAVAYMLPVAVVLAVGLCFGAQAILDIGPALDSRVMGSTKEKLEHIARRAALSGLEQGFEASTRRLSELALTNSSMLEELSMRGFPSRGFLYPKGLTRLLSKAISELTTGYQEKVEGLANGVGNADFNPLLVGFVAATEDALSDVSLALAGISEVRTAIVRAASAAFALLAIFGIASLAVSARLLGRLKREFNSLVAFGRGISGGDSASGETAEGADEIGELFGRLRGLSEARSSLKELRAVSGKLGDDERRLDAGVIRMASMVRDQAGHVGEAGTGFSSVVQSVDAASENASSILTTAASGEAELERIVERLRRGIAETRFLDERSSKIEEVVALIADIADQTELLSLNAAIEAAHAEEAGKGFSTVAQQVRKLADKSGQAASEISDLIEGVLDAVRRVASEVRESFPALVAVQKDLAAICSSLQGISASLSEATSEGGRVSASLASAIDLTSHGARDVEQLEVLRESVGKEIGEVGQILSKGAAVEAADAGRRGEAPAERLAQETHLPQLSRESRNIEKKPQAGPAHRERGGNPPDAEPEVEELETVEE